MTGNIKHIIGLVGQKGVGKDSFYTACLELYLEKKLQLPSKRFAFADALKEEVAKKLGISVLELNANKLLYRKELQDIGVSRRKDDEDYWIGRVAWKMLNFERQTWNHIYVPSLVVVTDVRFKNEADWIRSIGGKLVGITRLDLVDDGDRHESEIEQRNIVKDIHVINEGKGRYNLYKMQILDTLHQLGIA